MRGTVHVLPTEAYFALVRHSLAETGYAYVRVTGVSMQPLLRHLRDGVVISPPGAIHRGDIVLYDRQNGRYALHRVIRTKAETFDMMGDHQWHMDRGLYYGQIVGTVILVERSGKSISAANPFLKAYAFLMCFTAFPRDWLRKIKEGARL